jgi:membrane fusion protein (multidrug efflux system)
VTTIAEVRQGVLLVPKTAIKEIQGTYQVYIVSSDGVVEQRIIQVGPMSGSSQVVENGLADGEVIAIEGIQKLRSGMQITPKPVALP